VRKASSEAASFGVFVDGGIEVAKAEKMPFMRQLALASRLPCRSGAAYRRSAHNIDDYTPVER